MSLSQLLTPDQATAMQLAQAAEQLEAWLGCMGGMRAVPYLQDTQALPVTECSTLNARSTLPAACKRAESGKTGKEMCNPVLC